MSGQMTMLVNADPGSELVTALWPAVASGELSAILTVLAAQGMARLPDFALAHSRPDGVLVLIRGAMSAEVYSGAVLIETVRAGSVTTWREASFDNVDGFRLCAGAPVPGDGLPLLAGVVAASQLSSSVAQPPRSPGSITREWREPVPAPPASHTAPPIPALPAHPPGMLLDRLSWLDSEPAPAAAVMPEVTRYGDTVSSGQARTAMPQATVAAVHCPKLHLNPPATPVCRECLLPLDPDQEPFLVAQPVIGRLRRVDSEDEWPVAKKLTILGRSPAATGLMTSVDLQLVQLERVSQSICDVHAEVRLDGWRLEVVDRSDRGATMVTNPGDGPVRLEPGVPMRLLLGGKLSLADEVSFEFGL